MPTQATHTYHKPSRRRKPVYYNPPAPSCKPKCKANISTFVTIPYTARSPSMHNPCPCISSPYFHSSSVTWLLTRRRPPTRTCDPFTPARGWGCRRSSTVPRGYLMAQSVYIRPFTLTRTKGTVGQTHRRQSQTGDTPSPAPCSSRSYAPRAPSTSPAASAHSAPSSQSPEH